VCVRERETQRERERETERESVCVCVREREREREREIPFVPEPPPATLASHHCNGESNNSHCSFQLLLGTLNCTLVSFDAVGCDKTLHLR
jgi:hypothetical protein